MTSILFLAAFAAFGADDCRFRAYPDFYVSTTGAIAITGAHARVTCSF
jgi:hypothetical protein